VRRRRLVALTFALVALLAFLALAAWGDGGR